MLDGQAKVFGALSKDEDALMELVTDLNQTVAAFAAQEDNLKAAIPRLRDVFREGRPALASLNEALPEIRGFARDALPGARSSSPTLDAQLPFIKQARRLVSPSRAGRPVAPAARGGARPHAPEPPLAAHARPEPLARPLPEPRAAPVRRDARSPTPTSRTTPARRFSRESPRAFVGLAGESRLQDANSPYFRTQAGAGATTLLSTGEAGEPLRAPARLPARGRAPRAAQRPAEVPPRHPL